MNLKTFCYITILSLKYSHCLFRPIIIRVPTWSRMQELCVLRCEMVQQLVSWISKLDNFITLKYVKDHEKQKPPVSYLREVL